MTEIIINESQTLEEIQAEFEAILAKKPAWAKYTGSQFTDGISVFVAQMVLRSERFAQRKLQEAHITLASNRASILAKSNDRGFVHRKRTPSRGYVRIENSTNIAVSISAGEEALSPDLVPIQIISPVDVPANSHVDVYVEQLKRTDYQTTVLLDEPYIEVTLTKAITEEVSRVEVWVLEPSTGGISEWEMLHLFRGATDKSKVYTEYYLPSEQLGFRFGNGISGKIPEVDSLIQLRAYSSEGNVTLSDGQTFSFTRSALNRDLTITSILSPENGVIPEGQPITGGADWATTEEIRAGATYSTVFDEQVVWDSDYEHYIKQSIPELVWVNVWGEYEEEAEAGGRHTDHINTIFASAYSPLRSQIEIELDVLNALTERIMALNLRVQYRDAVAVPVTFTLTGTVPIHRNLSEVAEMIRNAIDLEFGGKSEHINEGIKEKDMWLFINNLGLLNDFKLDLDTAIDIKLNEFIFLDAINSDITISYERML